MPKIETPEEFVSNQIIGHKHDDAVAAITVRDAAIRAESSELLRVCGEALEAFAKFNDAMKFMGGNFPQTGVVYGVNSGFPHGAEITREDFAKAHSALAALNNAGVRV